MSNLRTRRLVPHSEFLAFTPKEKLVVANCTIPLLQALIWWAFLGQKWLTSLRSRAKVPSGNLCSVWWALRPSLAKLASTLWEASHEVRESPQDLISWPQPRAGPTVKLFIFLGKREQASVVSIEGGHCPGVPWTFFEISGLLLHLKNKKNSTMTDNEWGKRQSSGLNT